VEEVRDGAYRRTMALPNGPGTVSLSPRSDHVACHLVLHDLRDVPTAIARCRRLLDLDADPEAVDAALAADPALRPLVRRAPGRRVPRTVDEPELAIRAVLGQQVSTAAARTHAARLAASHGTPVTDPGGGLTHLFPAAAQLLDVDPRTMRLPEARTATVLAVARALADGHLDLGAGAEWDVARHALAAIDGIGPWTIETIALRALGDPDALPATDLGVRRGAEARGLPGTAAALTARAERWRPWRGYAVQHLWPVHDHPINRWPPTEPPRTTSPRPATTTADRTPTATTAGRTGTRTDRTTTARTRTARRTTR
jgi:AraC family transcriptional regulator of adaptative response / DNA-3-methyladenine glycosylase II